MPRVLVVDDTPELVHTTVRRLQSLGYEVDSASNGRAALEAIERCLPDAVILDVMMPELNGFQVCRRIKQNPAHAGVKVLMLTAKASSADRFWGEQAGADAYMTKPVDPRLLVQKLAELVNGETGGG